MLRQHLHIRQNRHEVRIAGPAGDDVLVHVVDDAGAGDAAEVPTEVVALGLVRGRERAETLGGEAMELENFILLERAEVADVPERRHQEVARGVRKLVQKHERLLATVDDERLLVRSLRGAAEEAALVRVRLLDVFQPPRSPELLRHGAGAYAAR